MTGVSLLKTIRAYLSKRRVVTVAQQRRCSSETHALSSRKNHHTQHDKQVLKRDDNAARCRRLETSSANISMQFSGCSLHLVDMMVDPCVKRSPLTSATLVRFPAKTIQCSLLVCMPRGLFSRKQIQNKHFRSLAVLRGHTPKAPLNACGSNRVSI